MIIHSTRHVAVREDLNNKKENKAKSASFYCFLKDINENHLPLFVEQNMDTN